MTLDRQYGDGWVLLGEKLQIPCVASGKSGQEMKMSQMQVQQSLKQKWPMRRRDGDHDYGRIPLGENFRTNLVFVTPLLSERELHWGEGFR